MFRIELEWGTVPRRLISPRSILMGLRDKVKEELDGKITLGVIESVEQLTDWCAPCIVVP